MNELTIFRNPGAIQQQIQQLRRQHRESFQNLATTIQRETLTEREELERSLKNYQDKINQIMERPDIKQKIQTHDKYARQLEDIQQKVIKLYHQAVEYIRTHTSNLTEARKQVQALEEKIEEAFLSPDERKSLQRVKNELQRFLREN